MSVLVRKKAFFKNNLSNFLKSKCHFLKYRTKSSALENMMLFDKCVLILHFDPLLWPQIMRIVGLPTFLLTQRRNELPSWKIYGS